MDLAFKELEELIAAHYGVTDTGAVALRSRLKHLQRLGFPAEVNTGKGRRAKYGWPQIIELFVGLELIDAGLTPEVASSLVSKHRRNIFLAAATFAASVKFPLLSEWVSEERCPLSAIRILTVTAGVLKGLSKTKGLSETDESELGIWNGEQFVAWLASDTAFSGSFCFINMSSRLLTMMNMLSARASVDLGASRADDHVIGSFIAWTEAVMREVGACL